MLYQGIFLSYRQGSGFILGNAVTAVVGLCLAFFAMILFLDSLRALNLARGSQR